MADEQPKPNRLPSIQRLTYTLLFLIMLFYVLIIAKNFLYPLALAILFAYLLHPIAAFLEEKGLLPRILANIVTIFVGFAILAVVGFFLYTQLSIFVEDVPAMKATTMTKLNNLEIFLQTRLGINAAAENGWLRDKLTHLFENSSTLLSGIFTATTGAIARIALLPVFVFFLLFYREKYKNFIMMLVPQKEHDKAERILDQVSDVMRNYIVGVFTVVAVLCVLNSIGLLIVGLKYAILLGILSAIMNFIPYFGTLIGGAIPLLVAILTEESPSYAIGVIILFIIIQFTENNILTPSITGGNVNINPMVTILSIIVAGMMWGLPGMFVVIPFLGMLKLIFQEYEHLRPYAYILGQEDTEQHAVDVTGTIRRVFSLRSNKANKKKDQDENHPPSKLF